MLHRMLFLFTLTLCKTTAQIPSKSAEYYGYQNVEILQTFIKLQKPAGNSLGGTIRKTKVAAVSLSPGQRRRLGVMLHMRIYSLRRQSGTNNRGRTVLELRCSAGKVAPRCHFRDIYRAVVSNPNWRAAVLLEGRGR